MNQTSSSPLLKSRSTATPAGEAGGDCSTSTCSKSQTEELLDVLQSRQEVLDQMAELGAGRSARRSDTGRDISAKLAERDRATGRSVAGRNAAAARADHHGRSQRRAGAAAAEAESRASRSTRRRRRKQMNRNYAAAAYGNAAVDGWTVQQMSDTTTSQLRSVRSRAAADRGAGPDHPRVQRGDGEAAAVARPAHADGADRCSRN